METFISGSLHQLEPDTFVHRRNVTKAHISDYLYNYNLLVLTQDTVIFKFKTALEKLIQEKNVLLDEVDQLKTSKIAAQNSIIELQKELLICKDEQLSSLQSSVSEAVQSSVKKEIKSYSEAVSASQKTSAPVPAMKSLKRAMTEVVQAEDRSTNLIVYGMKETAGEETGQKIEDLFAFLGEKLRQESVRVGATPADFVDFSCRQELKNQKQT